MTKLRLTSFGTQRHGARTSLLIESSDGSLFLDFGRDLLSSCTNGVPATRPHVTSVLAQERPTAVLLSHAHPDHAGDVRLLPPGTICVSDPATRLLLGLNEQCLDWQSATDDALVAGAATVRSFRVDHSVPGSVGFIINIGDKCIAFTGDLRFHGVARDSSEAFVQALREARPDVLICEGTHAGDEGLPEAIRRDSCESESTYASEADVLTGLRSVMNSRDDVVIVDVSPMHIERLESVWASAILAGRQFVIGERHATAVLALSVNDPKYHAMIQGSILLTTGALDNARQDWQAHGGEVMPSVATLGRDSAYAICLPNCTSIVASLAALGTRPSVGYVRSAGGAHSAATSQHRAHKKEVLQGLGATLHPDLHVSGHARPDDIRRLVEAAQPGTVVPVHTRQPAAFERWHDRVVTPRYLEQIEL
jgi:ribonuclease J